MNAGVNISSYTNMVYSFPSNACAFSGSSTVGGNPSQAWIKGDWFGIEAGLPLINATGTFTMIRPDGRSIRQTIITGIDGRALFSYKFNKKSDLIGTYQVTADANANSRTGQASTSLLVNK